MFNEFINTCTHSFREECQGSRAELVKKTKAFKAEADKMLLEAAARSPKTPRSTASPKRPVMTSDRPLGGGKSPAQCFTLAQIKDSRYEWWEVTTTYTIKVRTTTTEMREITKVNGEVLASHRVGDPATKEEREVSHRNCQTGTRRDARKYEMHCY